MNGVAPEGSGLEFVRVGKSFRTGWLGRFTALDDATVAVGPGEICAVVGPNGSGKSTLLKLAAGLLAPTSGSVRVLGEPAGSPAAARSLGFLPESPYFPPHLCPVEFLRFCAELGGLPKGSVERAIAERLEWAGLQMQARRPVSILSKGQRQRLGLVQALLHSPQVLVLDEPVSGLDPRATASFLVLLKELRSQGVAVLLSSHFLPQVEESCDRVVLLEHGRVVWTGAPDPLMSLERIYLGQTSGHDCG